MDGGGCERGRGREEQSLKGTEESGRDGATRQRVTGDKSHNEAHQDSDCFPLQTPNCRSICLQSVYTQSSNIYLQT